MQSKPTGAIVGLCETCAHAHVVRHPRGGEDYWRCTLAESNPAYPKYPRLPVTTCTGYHRGEPES